MFFSPILHQDSSKITDKLEKLVQRCTTRIRTLLGGELPLRAVVLGSGFDEVLSAMRLRESVPFSELPGFPAVRVAGHSGRVALAEIGSAPILVCAGRAHYYEGLPMEQITFPVRVMAGAGVKEMLLTNAAGGINARYQPGDFMLFSDHINFTGVNPLRGLVSPTGAAFVDLSQAYDPELRTKLREAARREKITLHEGVYLGVSGPSYETPAEIRAFRAWGADAVGMSTIPEVLVARSCGLKVAAVSCITNWAAGLTARPLSHAEVLATGRESARRAIGLIQGFAGECLDYPKAECPGEKL